MSKKKMAPVHPGEVLQKDFLEPLQLSHNQLGRDLGVSAMRINQLVNHKRGITADTALRLARYFKMSADFWMGLQKDYELEVGRDKFEQKIRKQVKPGKFYTVMDADEKSIAC